MRLVSTTAACSWGSVFDLSCRHAAELADGTSLGTFPNRKAANDAVISAAKGVKGLRPPPWQTLPRHTCQSGPMLI